MYKRIGDLKGEVNSLFNIGAAYQELGKNDEALKYYNRCREISGKAGFKDIIAAIQKNKEIMDKPAV